MSEAVTVLRIKATILSGVPSVPLGLAFDLEKREQDVTPER
jgi:hypothetical protein